VGVYHDDNENEASQPSGVRKAMIASQQRFQLLSAIR
jgi:hypothetical protein